MKKIVKPILQVLSLALVLVTVILFISNVLCFQCSSDEARLKLFYNEKEDSFEVMLFGSSSVRAGFIPTQAYEKYGITSYDYCINHMPMATTKYMIKEALSTQSPKLIVIDINAITYCNKEATHTASVGFTDSIKDGTNRSEAIKALSDEESWEDQLSFVKYHKNIYSLSKCLKYGTYYQLYGNHKTILKGYTTNPAHITPFEDEQVLDHNQLTEVATFNEYESECVEDLMNYCNTIKDTTEILFVRFPRPTIKNLNEWEMKYINAMEKRIEEEGYTFVDFTDYLDEIGIDMLTDFTDETHFNQFGAEKFTDYLCEYMKANYELTEYSDLSDWDYCVEMAKPYYEVIKDETLKQTYQEYFELDFAKRYKVFGVA